MKPSEHATADEKRVYRAGLTRADAKHKSNWSVANMALAIFAIDAKQDKIAVKTLGCDSADRDRPIKSPVGATGSRSASPPLLTPVSAA